MNTSNSSQAPTFRQAEISRLLNHARAGASASIIGVSGTGKSNLFNHLLDPLAQSHYLGDHTSKYIFVRVNFHYMPDFTIRSVYSLILEQLELLDERLELLNLHSEQIKQIGRYHEALLDAGDDVLKVQRYFNLAIRTLLGRSKRQLIFLFDQFEEVYQNATPRLFTSLRGLREAYKYRLSYFVFTRNTLLKLAETDPAREEFYELLAPNVTGLGPYNPEDASSLLRRVSRRYQLPLNEPQADRLLDLSGGHAGLLRAAYLAVGQDGLELSAHASDSHAIAKLLGVTNVITECNKIWNSIMVEERRLLARYAHYSHDVVPNEGEQETQRQLQLKGLLIEVEGPASEPRWTIFSPLFAAFVKTQESLWEKPIYFDGQIRSVWVQGQPTKPLTALEFNLFSLLHERAGEVVQKEELIQAGWPDAQGGVTDEAINAVMARLRRKVEPDPRNHRFVKTVRGQGYRLNME
ncbi:MAG: winged helix-turn-helix domain-containing protein [Ardenticatenaceae bacterium]